MNQHIDKIQDYIDGLLEGEELVAFEEQLAKDQELQSLVDVYLKVGTIVRQRESADTENLRNNLKSSESAVRQSGSRPIFSIKKMIPVLAAACALIVFSVFYFRSTEDLYMLPTMRSEIVRGQEAENNYEDAVHAFNHQDYAKANDILSGLILQDSSNLQYQYYAALTFVGKQEWEKAINQLNPIADGESVYADEAKYYLAISYYKTGQNKKAISLLTSISDQGKLGEKSARLLKKIE